MPIHAKLPMDHLQQTFRSLLPDEIAYTVHTEDEPTLFYNEDTHEVFLYGPQEIRAEDRKPQSLLGRVAVMRVFSLTPDGTLLDGYIASVRFAKDPIQEAYYSNDMPGDVEEETEWMEDHKNRVPLLGLESRGPNGRPVFNGNELARSAMKFLSTEMNMLHKQHNEKMITRKTKADESKSTSRRHSRSSK